MNTATSDINSGPYQLFGVIFSLTALAFFLLHSRILWVLCTQTAYRKQDCYRLLMQISITEMTMCPGYILIGLSRLFSFYPWPVAINALVSTNRVEVFLSFVLAVNRLKVMAGFRYSDRLHMILAALGWLIGMGNFTLLASPCCRLHILPNHYKISIDEAFPGTILMATIGSSYALAMNGLILTVYVVLFGYMIRIRLTFVLNKPSLFSMWKQNSILIFAIIRFMCDSSYTCVYHFGAAVFPVSLLAEVVLMSANQLDRLILMPVLLLAVSKSIRHEVFPFLESKEAGDNHTTPTGGHTGDRRM
ncbi:hypothetical protein QR680_015555 [Steinernema hermaphroditum]|uniref:Uncharacterized protein n=1 Tax=Steinernema hermaphroditum TaxID=289476 RepID=A0AA39LKT9_9BILA|nr:hypothetical protein QR680_015555 [Steinernema hermaphroditum]